MTTFTIKLPNGSEIDSSELTASGLEYAVNYGLRQSMNDSIAGLVKELEAKGLDKATIENERIRVMTERFDAIQDGSVGTRAGGPRLRGIDAYIRDVADAWIKAKTAGKGKKLPKGEDYTKLRNAYIEANREAITAEAQRQMDEAEAGNDASDILDELLG